MLIGKDQMVMGKTHAFLGRTIDILIPIGNDWVAMGKAHMNIWEGPLIHFILIGKDQGVMGKDHAYFLHP